MNRLRIEDGGARIEGNTETKINSYQDLIVWQKSVVLVEKIYQLTAKFPSSEKFGLTSQLKRAAISIPSNIAEGYGRHTTKERIQFLIQARGSSAEIETQLIIARKLGFASENDISETQEVLVEVKKMLSGLSKALSQT